jgi:tetratricopeptide (TPR) repeat protein
VTNVLPAAVLQAQRQARRAIDGYGMLLAPGDTGAEARLRMGYLHFRLGEPQAALDAFAAVAAEPTADAFVRYLAHYFTGRVYDRRPLRSEAVAAYRRALEIIPGAQSAGLALATALFEDGRPDDAYAVMEEAAAVAPVPPDPWRLYGYGDLRHWPDLVDPLRAQVMR